MIDCEDCQGETSDVEEYCHRCGKVACFDCLKGEWCESCNRKMDEANK